MLSVFAASHAVPKMSAGEPATTNVSSDTGTVVGSAVVPGSSVVFSTVVSSTVVSSTVVSSTVVSSAGSSCPSGLITVSELAFS